jgi:tRNA-splicing ligase RtcB (3'-phosphate/5'-hydroxy nucleic acid ligase)
MITGMQLLEIGWPQGAVIGLGLEMAERLAALGKGDEEIIAALEHVRHFPDQHEADGDMAAPLALAWRKILFAPKEQEIRSTPLDAPVWGADIIDPGAIEQLQNAMRLPVTVGGALMPDAHIGYGIPIGGVVALDNAVAPYMVGVDIACRMMMSIYPAPATAMFDNEHTRDQVRRALKEETRFGIGAQFGKYDRREHDVLDDDDWEATRLLKHLKDKAYAQLGTSGSGNHFVDAGILEVDADGAAGLGLEPGRYLAIMSHSGSRGVGANIADYYSKLAQKVTPLPDKLRHLAWLPLSSEEGAEYWVSMNLAGRFASACHHTIHRAIGKRLGERPLVQVENHHNFAWEEDWGGRKVIVHRKGATPAHEGVLGIIPGSQGHDSFIVRGKGSEASINSASHGAGRQMSRKVAKERIPKRDRDTWLRQEGVELLGGGMDEAPQAYKNIHEVLALQTDLVEPIATFKPRIVLMSDDGKSED